MNPQAAQQNYLRTRVLTATPEQLQMMLFDGAIRYGEQARMALEKQDWENSHNAIGRVQKIVTELIGSLRPSINPDLCGKLASLYNFAYRKLIEANIQRSIPALDEGMNVLKFQRETWAMLLDQMSKQKAAAHASKIDMPAPDARMESSLRMTG